MHVYFIIFRNGLYSGDDHGSTYDHNSLYSYNTAVDENLKVEVRDGGGGRSGRGVRGAALERENKRKPKDPRFAPRPGHLFKKSVAPA